MSDASFKTNIGIGATDELSLRVSVATLVRVLFENPSDGTLLLALERKATLRAAGTERAVEVKSQPFGGALRIYDLSPLQNLLGDFHFDSEQSRSEQDFRLFIRPSDWESVWRFCIQHFIHAGDAALESDPCRELAEEFSETLKIHLKPDQFDYRLVGTLFEKDPSPAENVHARGYPTVRIYRIFESRIQDPSLAHALVMNSERYSNESLQSLALENARKGGQGWTNSVLTLPLHQISAFYETILPAVRNNPVSFQNHKLDETVAAVLEDVTVPKYERLLL
jgi:hypothetical protein